MRIVRKQERAMGRFAVRTPAMDTRIPDGEVWVRKDAYDEAYPDLSHRPEKTVESLIRKNPADACDGCAFFTAGRYGLGKCGFWKDTRTIDDTCSEFKPRMQPVLILVNPVETTDKYRRERQAPPAEFDSRSFRTVKEGKHRVIVGCPKGNWDNKRKTCRIGTRVQTVLHPKGEENPCGFEYNPALSVHTAEKISTIPPLKKPVTTAYNPSDVTKCMHCGGRIEYDPISYTWKHVGRTSTYEGKRYRAGEPHSHRAEPRGNPHKHPRCPICGRYRYDREAKPGHSFAEHQEATGKWKNPDWDDPWAEPPKMKCRQCGQELYWDSTKWVHGTEDLGEGHGSSHYPDPVPIGNPAYPTESIRMRTEEGDEVEVQVPADFLRMRRAWEEMRPINEELFKGVQDKSNWKSPIGPIHFDEYAPAQLMADAISFFHGGSEIDQAPDGGWIVSSKGYYEYTGG